MKIHLALAIAAVAAAAGIGCGPQDCGPCDKSTGTQFCTNCSSEGSTCTEEIVDSHGNTLTSCQDTTTGQSCLASTLAAECPDLND